MVFATTEGPSLRQRNKHVRCLSRQRGFPVCVCRSSASILCGLILILTSGQQQVVCVFLSKRTLPVEPRGINGQAPRFMYQSRSNAFANMLPLSRAASFRSVVTSDRGSRGGGPRSNCKRIPDRAFEINEIDGAGISLVSTDVDKKRVVEGLF